MSPPPDAPIFKKRRSQSSKRRRTPLPPPHPPRPPRPPRPPAPPSRHSATPPNPPPRSRFGNARPAPRPPTRRPHHFSPSTTPSRPSHNLDPPDALHDRAWYVDQQNTFGQDTYPVKQRVARPPRARIDHDQRWETRQLAYGLNRADRPTQLGGAVSDDALVRMALLVREQLPAFLDKPVLSTAAKEDADSYFTLPVRDPTSNMAVIARKGSPLVAHYRQVRERNRAGKRYWELGTSAGAKEQQSEREHVDSIQRELAKQKANEWKPDAYADHMTSKTRSKSDISAFRRSLPVHSVRDGLMSIIREHQVCVIIGETGSGKTTQLTQYLVEEGYSRYGMVACTQPRRVATVSVAQRVAGEFRGGVELGKEVGYVIRFEDYSSKNTLIKYMTDGILLRETLTDPELDKYSVVVMDEAHERSLNTDILFGILRQLIVTRRDLKLIITSATLNAERFSTFFGGAPIYNIPGRTFPVDVMFAKTPFEDYVDAAVWQAIQLHVQAPVPGDILIFMTGQEDIETTCEALANKVSTLENPHPIIILPVYSQLPTDMQARIFEPAPEGTRKVIVATNIAETSLTIDGIRYVIDPGYCKLKTYNPRLGIDALLLCPISQASVNQRSGRAGRTGPGKCFRLFTQQAFLREMLDTNVPEIQRTNLSHVVLLLKTLGVKEVLDFPFLDPPPAENIMKSMSILWLLDALDTNGDLTDLGRKMSSFPLDPGLSSLLFMGEKNGCLLETITIVSMLSVPNVFMRPPGSEEESDSAREKFLVPESDHLTLLHVYQRWRAAGCRSDWCSKHYISGKSMRKAREIREHLLEIVKNVGLRESSSEDFDDIRRAIGCAFFYQASRRKGIGEYINVRSGVVCGLHPTSAMYGSSLTPDYVVYHELIMTKKEYMSCVTAVEPQWLAEAGKKVYILKQAADDEA